VLAFPFWVEPPVPKTDKASDISDLLRERVRAVFRHLPKGLAGDEEAIHQMRIAGRRLRVALPLLARKPEGRRVHRALRVLRELTRTAGASRDLDVGMELLAERLRAVAPLDAEQRRLRSRLRGVRAYSRTKMAEALMDLEIARLRRDLRAVLAKGAEDAFSVRVRLRDIRDDQGEALLKGFESLSTRFEPEGLHALRRQARKLRYAAELGDVVRGGAAESRAPALFKTLQEQIGKLHDHYVLAGWLDSQAASAEGRGETALAAAARAQSHWATTVAATLHRQLLDARPIEIATRALEAMGRSRTAA
jgi:CHAD domain-containing protein